MLSGNEGCASQSHRCPATRMIAPSPKRAVRVYCLRFGANWTTEKHSPRGAVIRHAGETAAYDPVVVRRRQSRRRSPQSDAIGSCLLSCISATRAKHCRDARSDRPYLFVPPCPIESPDCSEDCR
jgi:hypothetical protein